MYLFLDTLHRFRRLCLMLDYSMQRLLYYSSSKNMANLMTTCQFGMDNDTADSDTVSALSALSEYRLNEMTKSLRDCRKKSASSFMGIGRLLGYRSEMSMGSDDFIFNR
eukprot:48818_1